MPLAASRQVAGFREHPIPKRLPVRLAAGRADTAAGADLWVRRGPLSTMGRGCDRRRRIAQDADCFGAGKIGTEGEVRRQDRIAAGGSVREDRGAPRPLAAPRGAGIAAHVLAVAVIIAIVRLTARAPAATAAFLALMALIALVVTLTGVLAAIFHPAHVCVALTLFAVAPLFVGFVLGSSRSSATAKAGKMRK